MVASLLQEVKVTPKYIDDYETIVGRDKINKLKELSAPLKGKKVLNINATAFGGGVVELLKTSCSL